MKIFICLCEICIFDSKYMIVIFKKKTSTFIPTLPVAMKFIMSCDCIVVE